MLIYNTESQNKETFEPWGSPVKMYVCGLTPKNDPHVGHARVFVLNDVFRRYLEYRGYEVKYIQNFTDVDDKIIAAGHRDGIQPEEAARLYIDGYFRDMDALNVRRATEYTYVTQFIPAIISTVQGLIDRGYAYEAGGDVFYRVAKFADYGRLSNRNEEAMQAGARVEPDEKKEDPRDFALWKAAKPGEPWWESPWGKGRPGWHIECSTMILETLGEQIDIHGGGQDLIFPHHENEIAQSEAYTGKPPFVKYWVHTGFFKIKEEGMEEAQKMAHSGTFVTIRSVLEHYKPTALRLYLLSQHYRTPMEFSEQGLVASYTRWQRYAETYTNTSRLLSLKVDEGKESVDGAEALLQSIEQNQNDFIEGMDDDFNTARGLSVLDDLSKQINTYASTITSSTLSLEQHDALERSLKLFEELSEGVLGIQLSLEETGAELDASEIEKLVDLRNKRRRERDWTGADEIRSKLENEYGIVLKDHAQGTSWQRK